MTIQTVPIRGLCSDRHASNGASSAEGSSRPAPLRDLVRHWRQRRLVDRRSAASTRLRSALRLSTCMREKPANQPSRMRFSGRASSAYTCALPSRSDWTTPHSLSIRRCREIPGRDVVAKCNAISPAVSVPRSRRSPRISRRVGSPMALYASLALNARPQSLQMLHVPAALVRLEVVGRVCPKPLEAVVKQFDHRAVVDGCQADRS